MDDKKKTMYTIHESFRRASDQLEKLEKSQARKKKQREWNQNTNKVQPAWGMKI